MNSPTVNIVDPPEEHGCDPEGVTELLGLAERQVSEGPLPSCQVAVARHGRLIAFASFGPATDATRYLIYSASKPITASALWLLIGEQSLDVRTPVVDLIPEFGENGKSIVTVEQLMLHTAGIPNAPMERGLWHNREARVARFAEWSLEWEPGTAFAYHGSSAHWVMAELIERLGRQDYRSFIRERIFQPLGLTRAFVGVAEEDQDDIPVVVSVGSRGTPEDNLAVKGLATLPAAEVVDAHFLQYNLPESRTAGTPSSGAVMNAADLALLYQAWIHNPGELWVPDVLADATQTVRNTFPVSGLGISANRSLGLMIAGIEKTQFRHSFGEPFSSSAFGHTGAAGQLSWVDPGSGLSFAFLTHALDADLMRAHHAHHALCDTAARLAGPTDGLRP
jgi:CubicO group peptidase (beta-lactamase class C family)